VDRVQGSKAIEGKKRNRPDITKRIKFIQNNMKLLNRNRFDGSIGQET